MARFRFRLETLRKLRQAARNELRVRLAEAYQAEQILAEQQAAVTADLEDAAAVRRRLLAEGAVDVTRLLETQRFQLLLEAQRRVLTEQSEQLGREVESRRLAVVEADREVKVLDKLRERRAQEHRAQQASAEAKQFDEIAAIRWEGRDR